MLYERGDRQRNIKPTRSRERANRKSGPGDSVWFVAGGRPAYRFIREVNVMEGQQAWETTWNFAVDYVRVWGSFFGSGPVGTWPLEHAIYFRVQQHFDGQPGPAWRNRNLLRPSSACGPTTRRTSQGSRPRSRSKPVMRKFPVSGARGRPMLFARRRLAWLAMWFHDLRRAQQATLPPVPNAPTRTGGSFQFDVTQSGWADLTLSWTFVHGTFPVATIELWKSLNGDAYTLLVAGGSTASAYSDALAGDINGGTFDFKARDVNGATLGPFSNVLRVDVSAI